MVPNGHGRGGNKGLYDVIDVECQRLFHHRSTKKNVDNIVGIVRAKDILKFCRDSRDVPISAVMQPAYFVRKARSSPTS